MVDKVYRHTIGIQGNYTDEYLNLCKVNLVDVDKQVLPGQFQRDANKRMLWYKSLDVDKSSSFDENEVDEIDSLSMMKAVNKNSTFYIVFFFKLVYDNCCRSFGYFHF